MCDGMNLRGSKSQSVPGIPFPIDSIYHTFQNGNESNEKQLMKHIEVVFQKYEGQQISCVAKYIAESRNPY